MWRILLVGTYGSLYHFRYMLIFIPLFNYHTLNSGIVINNFQELLLYEMD